MRKAEGRGPPGPQPGPPRARDAAGGARGRRRGTTSGLAHSEMPSDTQVETSSRRWDRQGQSWRERLRMGRWAALKALAPAGVTCREERRGHAVAGGEAARGSRGTRGTWGPPCRAEKLMRRGSKARATRPRGRGHARPQERGFSHGQGSARRPHRASVRNGGAYDLSRVRRGGSDG